MAISEMAAEIFKGELNGFCTEDLKERYLHRLNEMELVTVSPRVRQKQLAEMLLSFYGKTTLMKYESLIDESVTDHNWLATYFRRKKRKLHPIRHLLLIYMLFSSLEELKSINIPKEPEFFPCLNPVADHYKELIVQDVKWSMDSKTRKQVGTFRCHKCGFVYSRKIDTDPYRIGRIKEFGPIWYAKLKTLDRNLSLRAKARSMGCDPKTIVRYIDRN